MAKAPPLPPPTDEQLDRAAKSGLMQHLVMLANAFGAAGIDGPFEVTLPQLVQGWVTEKNGYRKISINAGAKFEVDKITIGKRAGLLFGFKPCGAPVADKDNPAWIELEWDDVVNAFGDLADSVDNRFAAAQMLREGATFADSAAFKTTSDVNEKIKETIKLNAGMHKIIVGGFERAHTAAAANAHQDYEEALDGFGIF